MKYSGLLLFCLCLLAANLHAQSDSAGIPAADTAAKDSAPSRIADTTAIAQLLGSPLQRRHSIPSFEQVLDQHPYYHFRAKPILLIMQPHKSTNKDGIFYALAGLLFFYALIHALFGRYLHNLRAVFFRVSMRQAQLREQLTQEQVPALLLNLLFVANAGLYLALLGNYFHWLPNLNLWTFWGYASLALLLLYVAKFCLLKVSGWIFSVSRATNTYILIVFMVNKMIGIALLPLLWMLAFPHPALIQVVITLSVLLLAALFIYRFILSYRPVRSEIKWNPFHFFIYLCAFEIAPLLLIYKVLIEIV